MASDRSISDVLQDSLRNLQDIVRSEVRLAKTEVREELTKAKSAGLIIGAGIVCAIFALFFLLLSAIYALSLVFPSWAAALIITGALIVVAAITLTAGIKQFKRIHPTPETTVGTMKENVAWAKQQVK